MRENQSEYNDVGSDFSALPPRRDGNPCRGACCLFALGGHTAGGRTEPTGGGTDGWHYRSHEPRPASGPRRGSVRGRSGAGDGTGSRASATSRDPAVEPHRQGNRKRRVGDRVCDQAQPGLCAHRKRTQSGRGL